MPLPSVAPVFVSLYFLGGLALGMALFREVYPYWRPGYVRSIYDLLLIALTFFFVLAMIFYLSAIKPV